MIFNFHCDGAQYTVETDKLRVKITSSWGGMQLMVKLDCNREVNLSDCNKLLQEVPEEVSRLYYRLVTADYNELPI